MSVASGVFFLNLSGFRFALGTCLPYQPIEDFNAKRFKGVWYEMQRDKTTSFETGDCVTAQYGYGDPDDSAKIIVENSQYFLDAGKLDQIQAYTYGSTFFPGQLAVYFFNTGVGVDYRVLATDYDNWAIIHSFSAFFSGLAVSEVTWILTRAPKVVNSADFMDILETVIPFYEDKITHYPGLAGCATRFKEEPTNTAQSWFT